MRRMFRPSPLPRLVLMESTLGEEGKEAMKLTSRTTIVALVLTVAGLALSAAQAATRPDERAGIRGIGQTSAVAQSATRPDDRAGIRGIGQTSAVATDSSDVVSRYLRNRTTDASDVVSRYVANVLQSSPAQAVRPDNKAGTLGPGNEAVSAEQTTLASSDGVNWTVALISVGGGLAFVLLLSATGMGVVRHRHSNLKSA
jgi:hypothetical protein